MLLITSLFRSTKTWQWYLILYDFGISFFIVCYVSDEVVSFTDSIPTRNVAEMQTFYTGYLLLIYNKETL